MSIAAMPIAETAIGAQPIHKSKANKPPARRQYLVRSDTVAAPEPR